jgi:undecaprenyl-diphosphatase
MVSIIIHNDADKLILDKIMPILRNPLSSIPIYLLLILWILINDKKRIWQFLAISVLLICLTDFISAQVLKPLFHRPRPLYDSYFSNFFRELVSKGGIYSFPSSHASNHFGLAFLWCGAYYKIYGKKIYWPIIWASFICYAQIYVGKHYLSDILAGALLGYLLSKLVLFTFLKFEANPPQFFRGIESALSKFKWR